MLRIAQGISVRSYGRGSVVSARSGTQASSFLERKALSPPLKPPLFKQSHCRFFKDLKEEEKRQFHRKRRLRFDYRKNSSASLTLPVSTRQLTAQKDNPDSLLELAKANIIEHSNIRVDLFFYTLIAYYKTSIIPTGGHTFLQHGKGRSIKGQIVITEACHSSLIPSLLDATIYHNEPGAKKKRSILSDTHFMENLNSTVELPSFVNELDDILEGTCRGKSLEILAKVAMGTLDPIAGMNLFLRELKTALDNVKKQDEHLTPLHRTFRGRRQSMINLVDLVSQGTFSTTFDDKTQSMKDEYIQLLLRLTPQEKQLCVKEEEKSALYLHKFISIQKEILEAKMGQKEVSSSQFSL